MKRTILLAASLAAIALAACSRGGPAQLPAGQWEMTAKVTQLDAPGAPEQAQAAMRSQLNREQTNRSCITQEQASNPLRDFSNMMTQGGAGANCQTQDNTFANGTIRMRVVCRGPSGQPAQATMAMEGSYTNDTLDATMTVNGEGVGMGGAQQSIRMTTTIHGRRIGDCPGGNGAPGGIRPGNTL